MTATTEATRLVNEDSGSDNNTETTTLLSSSSSSSSQYSHSCRTTPNLPQCSYVAAPTQAMNRNNNNYTNNNSRKFGNNNDYNYNNSVATTISSSNNNGNGGVNFSTNTLLMYRLQDMRSLSSTNLFLAVLCLIYMGINVTLVCVNYVNDRYVHTHGGSEEGEPVDDTVYHLVEFWATFSFAVVECVALAVTPKSQYSINGSMDPLFLKMVMFVNIVATSVPAVMISFSIETFEKASHEIEYINELTMCFVDVILLLSLWKSKSERSSLSTTTKGSSNGQAWCTTAIAMLVAMVQLGVYNLMGYDEERDDMVGEVPAHFLEFSFEIISSLIAFWFCMDNKIVADTEIGMILYGNHEEDCQICNNQVAEFHQSQTTTNTPNPTTTTTTTTPPAAATTPQQMPLQAPSSSYYQTV